MIPTQDETAWMRDMIRRVYHGQLFGMPHKSLLYRFMHDVKEIHFLAGDENEEEHQLIATAAPYQGYFVIDKRNEPQPKSSRF